MHFIDVLVCALTSITTIQIVAGLIGAYFVYRLGLRAYVRQKQYERFQKRYLEQGMDLWSSQLEYALGVYRKNWSLLLRIMKQYRDAEAALTTDDFFKQFRELDQSYFQIGPNAKIQSLLGTQVFWLAYQSVFSFVTNANDSIKADFGFGLNQMLKKSSHPNKVKFLEEAENLANDLNTNSKPLYEIVSKFNNLIELLAKSDYTTATMEDFKNRTEVREIIKDVKNLVGELDSENGFEDKK